MVVRTYDIKSRIGDISNFDSEKTVHWIIFGDSRNMAELEDETVHMVITSPPYVTSKFKKGQPFNINDYFEMIENVFKEIYRVLIKDGRFCLNIADIHTKYYYNDGRFLRIPLAHMVLDISLSMGFRLLDTFIWDKGFNRNKGGAPGPLFGSYPYPPTIYNQVYWEYIFVLIKPGKRRKVSREIKEKSKLTYERWVEYTRKIWRVESETEWIKEHPAVFPLEIPKRFIEMYSFKGDLILDPFLGSGTTTLAARLTGRNSVGYEINPGYADLIKKRVGIGQMTLSESKSEFKIRFRDDAREAEWL